MDGARPSRRWFLTGLCSVASLTVLTGCTDGRSAEQSEGGGRDTTERATTRSETSTQPSGEGVDLREANVIEVSVEQTNGASRFDVTLHHDDSGEEGYANWWQVERLDGTRLGRRELLHAHSQQPFTRSETIEIPEEVSCVVVRGHDQTHGYGGVARVVALDSGQTQPVDQGPERQSLEADDCPRGGDHGALTR